MPFVGMTNKKLIGARDPLGIRPHWCLVNWTAHMCWPRKPAHLISSARKFVREIDNGEVVIITKDGLESHRPFPKQRAAPLHIRVYLFRPTLTRSSADAAFTRSVRKWVMQLARESGVEADVVIPVP